MAWRMQDSMNMIAKLRSSLRLAPDLLSMHACSRLGFAAAILGIAWAAVLWAL